MWGATVYGPRTGAWRDAHAQCPYPTLMWGEPPSYYYEYRCDRPRTEMRRLSFRTTPKALEAAMKARYPRMGVIWHTLAPRPPADASLGCPSIGMSMGHAAIFGSGAA